MKRTKYLLFSALSLLLGVTLAFFGSSAAGLGSEELLGKGDRVTVLCLGLDNAAANTDVLLLLTVDPDRKTASVLQIPRDTYFAAETAQKKINQLYPYYRSCGLDTKAALAAVKADVALALGVPIDYYAAIDLSALSSVLERLGGLAVNVPCDIRLARESGDGYIEIPAGAQVLTGEQAVAFLRYRADYAEGDLGRIDAQKLLFAAVYRKVRGELSLGELASLVGDTHRDTVTDMPLSRRISLAYAFYRDRSAYGVRLATLPGAAIRSQGDAGTWYYVLHRQASCAMLAELGYAPAFDPEKRLTDQDNAAMKDLYEKNGVNYTIYTEETLKDLEIKINTK